jgi:hypothetical protein
MSELIDMKVKKTKKSSTPECVEYSPPEYPYGLKINLETEQCDKIPELMKMKPGDRVSIIGDACISSISIDQRQNDKECKSVSIQIEKMSVSSAGKKKLENMSMKEYRKVREGQ